MRLEVKKCLFDISAAVNDIEGYTGRLEYADYLGDGMVQAATERKFEIIGEALNRIARLDNTVLQRISQYHRIIGFRNVIVHGYDAIDDELVWDAIQNHLPKLRQEVERLIRLK